MASISAVKAYDVLQTSVCRDEFPRCKVMKRVFGMDNISATFVLGAWQGINFHKVRTTKQIVEAIQQNRLESMFKTCCSELATVNHHYAQKVLECYAAKGNDSLINFGLFNLRPETVEESIKAFKNYMNDLQDFAEDCKDTTGYVTLLTAGIRVPKPLAEIKTEMQALVTDFESTIASMPPDAAAKAADVLTDAKGVLSSLEQFE
jgi:hypothetical protein